MTRKELKDLIFECYVEVLRQQDRQLLNEDKDKEASMVFGGTEGATLPDSTDQMLAKFPTLKHALIRLHTDDFKEFVSGVDWISPKPTVFRVNLVNGQNYTLKWMGKDFEIEILGKRYYLGTLVDFQRVLEKMTQLYQEGPMGNQAEDSGAGEEGDTSGKSGGGGSFGDFPGANEGPGEEIEAGGEEPKDDKSEEGEGEDMSNASVDFEADSDI